MGWGTFAAGQALRYIRGRSRSTSDLSEVLYWGMDKFLNSYIARVIEGTVLIHPKIESRVDENLWRDQIITKAGRNWWQLVISTALIGCLWVLAFPPLALVICPIWWYLRKSALIKGHQRIINQEFLSEGFDVPNLMAEIPQHQERFKRELELAKQHTEKVQADQIKKRKFGN